MKPRCKLELNMQVLEKSALQGLPARTNFVAVQCLNCGVEYNTLAEKKKIFCSANCAAEYHKKRIGLM